VGTAALFNAFGVSECGTFRPENQDEFFIGETFIAVADGMGGGGDGKGAAREAIAACIELDPPSAEQVEELFLFANERVRSRISGGTTLSTLSLHQTSDLVVVAANVGDGRMYIATDDGLVLISQDHTQAADRVRNGDVGVDIRSHPRRNYLTQALGYPAVAPHLVERDVRSSDVLIVCTDGVWAALSDATIYEIVRSATTPEEAARHLVDTALAAGSRDNATAVVARVEVRERAAAPLQDERRS